MIFFVAMICDAVKCTGVESYESLNVDSVSLYPCILKRSSNYIISLNVKTLSGTRKKLFIAHQRLSHCQAEVVYF